MGPDNKAIVSSRTPTFLSMRSAIDQSKSLVFYESKRVRSTPLQSIAKINILKTDVLLLMNENSDNRRNASLPNKVAIQCKCSGVYFSSRCRPLWSWTEYIGSVWNLRQPTDIISGSRVLRMRLCQRCFFKRT